jgi:hypothetical protein
VLPDRMSGDGFTFVSWPSLSKLVFISIVLVYLYMIYSSLPFCLIRDMRVAIRQWDASASKCSDDGPTELLVPGQIEVHT